ncbi:MAG: restriction endonuclease, SacI family [Candidatus Nanopelagicales bacterium]|nr:restriction endonuclease, SacI family [Candidatus Nanopelagicales bacterium]MCF8536439.1 restriction endonuclease, SacI family [Candidatus Nanopelagicales bacterium]MCF8558124.1 restriction endonuclease, SacI family [Candidatus Nanopelagicales bacterium]
MTNPPAEGAEWHLDLEAVENAARDALRRRQAYRQNPAAAVTLPVLWRDRSVEIQASRFRTHFAAVVTGLLARATDAAANPLSLQVGGKPTPLGRYSAQSVWARFYGVAQGSISVNGLKSSPFVNGVYDQKKLLERGWSDNANTATVDRLVGWMEEVAGFTRAQAEAALDAFLLEVPDAPSLATVDYQALEHLSVVEVLLTVENFLIADTENGRRGQAFVAACLSLVHGDDVETPVSINDPSRKTPGDVWLVNDTSRLVAEAKQKTVRSSDVRSFAKEVGDRLPDGVAAYAALVNADSKKPLGSEWRAISETQGVLTAVYDSPAELLRDAVIWSGMAFTPAVTRLCGLMRRQLIHLAVAPSTLGAWDEALAIINVVARD